MPPDAALTEPRTRPRRSAAALRSVAPAVGALPSSDDYGSRVGRRGGGHPVYGARWRAGVLWTLLGRGGRPGHVGVGRTWVAIMGSGGDSGVGAAGLVGGRLLEPRPVREVPGRLGAAQLTWAASILAVTQRSAISFEDPRSPSPTCTWPEIGSEPTSTSIISHVVCPAEAMSGLSRSPGRAALGSPEFALRDLRRTARARPPKRPARPGLLPEQANQAGSARPPPTEARGVPKGDAHRCGGWEGSEATGHKAAPAAAAGAAHKRIPTGQLRRSARLPDRSAPSG
jgi:hypothetical protein